MSDSYVPTGGEPVDDALLMAYADDTLNAEQRQALEALIRARPPLQDKVDAFRRSRDVLQAAFASTLAQPPPLRLVEFILGASSPAVPPLRSAAEHRPQRRHRRQRLGWALAASIAAVAALSWQLMSPPPSPASLTRLAAAALEQSPSGDTLIVDGAEGQLEVTPLTTVRVSDGRYCRDFDVRAPQQDQGERLRACRSVNGDWVATSRPAALSAYEVAAGSELAEILSQEAEARLIASRWRRE